MCTRCSTVSATTLSGNRYFCRRSTGRELEHYNSGTMTRRTDNQEILGKDYLEVHPRDAKDKGVTDEDIVRIFSDRGSVNIPIKVSPHFSYSVTPDGNLNRNADALIGMHSSYIRPGYDTIIFYASR